MAGKLILDTDGVKAAIRAIRSLMEANKDYLIELDSIIGDGDLGLTMSKAFRVADETISDSEESDVGNLLIRIGMVIAKAAPSTMGTLIATGFLRGGKVLKERSTLSPGDVAAFFRAFSDGIMERGKTKPGNKTIVDVTIPVAAALEKVSKDPDADGPTLAEAAIKAARTGAENAKQLTSQNGKAAVYREKTVGKPDPGAAAGVLIVEGFFSIMS